MPRRAHRSPVPANPRRRPPRRLRIIGGLLVVAATVLMMTSAPAASARPRPIPLLSVATYNVHHCASTDGVVDCNRIAANIKASHADVIGVEELDRHFSDRTAFADQPAQLAHALGFHYVFGANLDTASPTPGQPDSEYGTAIFSRYPIVRTVHVLLPSTLEQRGLLGAQINVHGRLIWFWNTHLGLSTQERLNQVAVIKQQMRTDTAPTFFTGDLNAYPDDPEITALDTDNGRPYLTDLWRTAGRGDPNTFDSDDPKGRIDYIYSSPRGVVAYDVRVSHRDPLASDHLMVVARVGVR